MRGLESNVNSTDASLSTLLETVKDWKPGALQSIELQRVGLNNNKEYSLTSYSCADVLPNSSGSFLQSVFLNLFFGIFSGCSSWARVSILG